MLLRYDEHVNYISIIVKQIVIANLGNIGKLLEFQEFLIRSKHTAIEGQMTMQYS